MTQKITFCEECGDDVTYEIIELILQNELNGETYEYKGKKAICNKCGSEVYVAEIEDYNLEALYVAYNKMKDKQNKYEKY